MTFRLNGNEYRISFRLAIVASVRKENEKDPFCRDLGQDAAVWNPVDRFSIKEGAKLALTRALQRAFPDTSDRAEIWKEVLPKYEKSAIRVIGRAFNDLFGFGRV